jgi:endo-1,4-beta-xylanase
VASASIAPTEEIELLPKQMEPTAAPEGKPEEVTVEAGDDQRQSRLVRNVTRPTLWIHRPSEKRAVGAAVIVVPGGGHQLPIDKEGHDIGRWLNRFGVTAFVLKYRTGASRNDLKVAQEICLADVRRAVRLVRHRAAVWKIAPDRVGVMGFSFGGYLALRLAFGADGRSHGASDPVERESCRPSFLALVYPGAPELSAPPKPFPPTFIVHANDDPKLSSNVVLDIATFLQKEGVPLELHLFREGDHGFALGHTGGAVRSWPRLFENWMLDLGLLSRSETRTSN